MVSRSRIREIARQVVPDESRRRRRSSALHCLTAAHPALGNSGCHEDVAAKDRAQGPARRRAAAARPSLFRSGKPASRRARASARTTGRSASRPTAASLQIVELLLAHGGSPPIRRRPNGATPLDRAPSGRGPAEVLLDAAVARRGGVGGSYDGKTPIEASGARTRPAGDGRAALRPPRAAARAPGAARPAGRPLRRALRDLPWRFASGRADEGWRKRNSPFVAAATAAERSRNRHRFFTISPSRSFRSRVIGEEFVACSDAPRTRHPASTSALACRLRAEVSAAASRRVRPSVAVSIGATFSTTNASSYAPRTAQCAGDVEGARGRGSRPCTCAQEAPSETPSEYSTGSHLGHGGAADRCRSPPPPARRSWAGPPRGRRRNHGRIDWYACFVAVRVGQTSSGVHAQRRRASAEGSQSARRRPGPRALRTAPGPPSPIARAWFPGLRARRTASTRHRATPSAVVPSRSLAPGLGRRSVVGTLPSCEAVRRGLVARRRRRRKRRSRPTRPSSENGDSIAGHELARRIVPVDAIACVASGHTRTRARVKRDPRACVGAAVDANLLSSCMRPYNISTGRRARH